MNIVALLPFIVHATTLHTLQLGQLRLNPPGVILENIKEILEITQPLYPLTAL